jgi:hypothetical protein
MGGGKIEPHKFKVQFKQNTGVKYNLCSRCMEEFSIEDSETVTIEKVQSKK